jgi:hypothetical protein
MIVRAYKTLKRFFFEAISESEIKEFVRRRKTEVWRSLVHCSHDRGGFCSKHRDLTSSEASTTDFTRASRRSQSG